MVSAWLAVLLAANAPVKLAAPGLKVLKMSQDEQQYYSQHVAQQLLAQGIEMITASEVATLIGLERQRQLAGCGEGSPECVTEIAGALGVDDVLTGDLARFGNTFQVNLKVLASKDGRTLAAYVGQAEGEKELLEILGKGAASLARQLGGKPREIERGLRHLAWIPLVAGAIVAVAGAGLQAMAVGIHTELSTPPGPNGRTYTEAEARARMGQGATLQAFGMTGVAVGAAAMGTGGAMYVLGGVEEPISLGPLPVRFWVMEQAP